jgi:DNA sulfur modification protein DndD
MIFTTLTITDFGVFCGRHEVDLSPKVRRPIILFGGKNGAGKSTILEAIRICLYGAGALGVGVSREEYYKFLDRKIHVNPNALIQPTFASLKVEFSYSHADGLATYTITRSWERKGAKTLSEFLSVERNRKSLEEVEAENWQDFIRELIPPGVSQLFFFDGEKIQQLAEDTTDQQSLADAIKSLLGVDIVERLQSDLRLHISRFAKPEQNTSYGSQIQGLEHKVHRIKRKIDVLRRQRAKQEIRIQELRARIVNVESRFASHGGTFVRNRETLLQQEGTLKERITQLEEAVRHHCAGLLPFALLPSLCERLKAQLIREADSNRISAGKTVLASAKKELTARLKPTELFKDFPDVTDNTKNEIYSRIADALREPLGIELIETAKSLHQLSDATARVLMSWMDQANTDVAKTVTLASAALERAHREFHKVSNSLRAIPADDVIKPIFEELRILNQKLAKVSSEAILKDQEANAFEIEMADHQRRHAHLAQTLAAKARHSGRLQLLPRVQTTLDEYRTKLIENKVAQLQDAVTQCFNLLCRKKDSLRKIRIDPKTFAITLCDRRNALLPKTQLSAGEKQIYAISMLWALGKTSGRPLPIVIDTPLARLDSEHRKLLVEHYFPLASQQVIILSTDTEVDQEYFDALKPAIARVYHLDYDQTECATAIEPGYFWRERDEAYKVAAH